LNIEQKIKVILERNFSPDKLIIKNQSHLHKGHDGYHDNSHFSIIIRSSLFEDKPRIERHKMIYKTLKRLLKSEIHAIQIKALNNSEDKN
jgi:BolA protein